HPDGTVFAWVTLDLESFGDAVRELDSLTPDVKSYIIRHAPLLHARLREQAGLEPAQGAPPE
ncbi:MAG: hypothetical protein ACK2UO_16380, partial [Caldilineaceae bacterium]